MPENEATVIVLATFREGYEAYFAEYSARVRAYLDERGARVVRRQRVEATLYGGDNASLVMVIDVPSRATAAGMFFESDYLAIIPLRDQVFQDFHMYLAVPGDL